MKATIMAIVISLALGAPTYAKDWSAYKLPDIARTDPKQEYYDNLKTLAALACLAAAGLAVCVYAPRLGARALRGVAYSIEKGKRDAQRDAMAD